MVLFVVVLSVEEANQPTVHAHKESHMYYSNVLLKLSAIAVVLGVFLSMSVVNVIGG